MGRLAELGRRGVLLLWGALALVCALASAEEEDANAAPEKAAEKLVRRVTPEYAERVRFRCDAAATETTLSTEGGQLLISAPNVRECIRAYGYYLRHVAHVHLSWNGDCKAAASFVLPEKPISVPPTLPLNYALNYCALSYTAVHWDEARWMRELDLFALNGFRYVLVTSGLEKVWQGFLKDAGYPKKKIAAFIPSPCYSAWWSMGNLEGAGGPLKQSLIDSEAKLGRKIVQRLISMGLEPVLQGYVGLMPHDFSKYEQDLVPQGEWIGYTRPAVLRPDSERFPAVAKLWYKNLQAVYGTPGTAYAGDLFHEGGQTKGIDLGKSAAAVQQAMQEASPGSLWLLQAWAGNPKPELLAGTSVENTVILALHKNLSPGANIQRNYGGRRYVWCELANFGGNHGLYGGFDLLEQMEGNAGGASGLGILSEGLETNPIYYELFFERLNNRSVIDRQSFLKRYIKNRYNSEDSRLTEAFSRLAASVYTPNGQREGCLENIMCARPSFDAVKASTWSNGEPYYDPQEVLQAGKLMCEAAQAAPELLSLPTFRYDLTDVCRQVLADRAREQLPRCKSSFESGDRKEFLHESRKFCALITQMADLLATQEDFLLGAYLEGISRRAPKADAAAMRRNFLQLITTWRPDTSGLNDYAHRQFSELMSSYYLPRWQAFFRTAAPGKKGKTHKESNANNGEKVTASWQENEEVDAIQRAFPTAKTPLLLKPQGELLPLAKKILK